MHIIKPILLIISFNITAMESQENKKPQPPLQRLVPTLTDLCFLAAARDLDKKLEETKSRSYLDILEKKLPKELVQSLTKAYYQSYGWGAHARRSFNVVITGDIEYSAGGTFAIEKSHNPTIIDTIREKRFEIDPFLQCYLFKNKLAFITQSRRDKHDTFDYPIACYFQNLSESNKSWQKNTFFATTQPSLIQISPDNRLIAIASNDVGGTVHLFSANKNIKQIHTEIISADPITCMAFAHGEKNIYLATIDNSGKTLIYKYSIHGQKKKELTSFMQTKKNDGFDQFYSKLEISPQENCIILRYGNPDYQPKVFVKQHSIWKELPLSHSPDAEDTLVRVASNGSFIIYSEYKSQKEWPTYMYWPKTDTKKHLITVDGYLEDDELIMAPDSAYVIIEEHQWEEDESGNERWIPYKFTAANNWHPQKLETKHDQLKAWLHVPNQDKMYGITNDLKCLILNPETWQSYIPMKGKIDYCPQKNIVSYIRKNTILLFNAISGTLLGTIKDEKIRNVQNNVIGLYLDRNAELDHASVFDPASILFMRPITKLFGHIRSGTINEIIESKKKSPDV